MEERYHEYRNEQRKQRERESNTKIKRSKKDQHLHIQWHSKSVYTKFYLQLIHLFFPII